MLFNYLLIFYMVTGEVYCMEIANNDVSDDVIQEDVTPNSGTDQNLKFKILYGFFLIWIITFTLDKMK